MEDVLSRIVVLVFQYDGFLDTNEASAAIVLERRIGHIALQSVRYIFCTLRM